jgi:multiple antibiotic resistance protein
LTIHHSPIHHSPIHHSQKPPNFKKSPFHGFSARRIAHSNFYFVRGDRYYGSIPLLISLKEKMGAIRSLQVTLISGALMVLFLFAGKPFLKILGLDVRSFAVGGSVVIFLLGLEMVLGHEIFKGDKNAKSGSVVPIAFPIIAGSGTLTTIMSLKANFDEAYILAGILINLIVVYLVLKSLRVIERLLGPAGLLAVRKFFGVILLAIAVKIFSSNIGAFGK